ncbi:MAG: nuclear transport factor 2 family protein [Thermoleophilaceae bacterium]
MSAKVEVELVVRQFESFNAGDFAAVADAYAEDVTLVLNGLFAGRTETVTGKPEVLDWFEDVVFKEFVDSRFDVEESRGRGARVLIFATHRARGRHSGVPVEQRFAYIFTVREGRIERLEVWADRGAAVEALRGD